MNPRYQDRKTRAQMLQEIGGNDETIRKSAKLIAHATLAFSTSEGMEVVRYQSTNVIERKGNRLRLNSGGWKTPTTQRRLNDYQGVVSVQRAHKAPGWTVTPRTGKGAILALERFGTSEIPFIDGMEIDTRSGLPIGGKRAFRKALNKLERDKKFKRQIRKFCDRLKTEPVPNVSMGDCFYCQMREAKTGKDVLSTDCARLHVEENYLHGSLVLRAIERSGRNPAFWYRPGVVNPEIGNILYKYLKTVCGLA